MNPADPAPSKPIVIRAAAAGGSNFSRTLYRSRTAWIQAAALAGFSLYVIGVVLYLSANQWLCAGALSLGWAGILYWERARPQGAVLKIMLVAFALGGIGEWICVHRFHLWEYHFPIFRDGLPVWIGLVWGYLYAVFILIAEILEGVWQTFGDPVKRVLGIGLGIIFFLFLRAVFLRINEYISYYYVLFLAVGLTIWRSPLDVLTFLVAGAGGTFGEYLSIQKGLWHYTQPIFTEIGMPISLPLAWGLAAVYIRNAAREFWQSTLWLAIGGGVLYGVLRVMC